MFEMSHKSAAESKTQKKPDAATKGASRTVAPNSNPPSAASIGDIFGLLSAKKQAAPVRKREREESVIAPRAPRLEKATKHEGDGLFRDTSKTVEMNDDAFFGEALLEQLAPDDKAAKSKKSKKMKSRAATSAGASRKELRGFDRVVTEDEIVRMTSSNPNAGTTHNCPFDCDCCF